MTAVAPLPSTVVIGLSRGVIELKEFFRRADEVIFTFSLPAVLQLLMGLIFDEPSDGTDVEASQVLTASLIAYGVVSTAFISIGEGIALDREDGTLKRLRGTPATASAYFIGKIILVAVCTLAEIALLLAVGVMVFGMALPTQIGQWWTFTWLVLLCVVCCTLLGVAAGSLARSARSAPVAMNLPVLALQFVSGIFVSVGDLPAAMTTVAAVFPVKWMGQGFRSVFLPDSMAGQEVAGGWEHGRTALVLAAWCLAGLVLSLATFRWTDRDAG